MARIDLVSIYVGFAIDLFDKGDGNSMKMISVIMFILTATFFIYCVDKYLKFLRENIELKYLHMITTGKLNIQRRLKRHYKLKSDQFSRKIR